MGKLIGFHCEIIDPEKIKQINPFVNVEGVLAGAWTTGDGHVDPAGCCNALAKGARDMGATIARRTRVTDVKQRASGEWEVVTDQGNVVCEMVVNAAGCYARQVSRMAGTDVPITNMEHTYLVTEPIREFLERDEEMVVMRDPYASAYYRQEQKAGLIGIYEPVGSAECWSHRGGWPEWDAENELFEADLDRLAPYVERVLERMPIWRDAGIKRIVCGAIPHTPDANPLLGPAAGLKNFWQCCGASIGIASGAGCGKYLAQWMVHGDSEINMAGLDPRRFGGHAPGAYTKAKSHQDYEHMYVLMDSLVQGPRDGLDVTVANVTGDWGVLVLAGPRSREVLAKLTDAELGNGHFRWLTDRKIRHRPAPFPHKYYGGRVGLYQERRRGQGGMGSPGGRCCPRRKRAANRLLRHRLIHSPLRLRIACMRHSQLEGDAPTVAASTAKRHGTWSCYP